MINYYQPFLLPFLRRKRYRLPSHIRQTYFVSFEDALWVLLRTKHIAKGSTVLIPDFYCTDVVDNIQHHGYAVVRYKVDRNFATSKAKLTSYIDKYRPSVVILFHACGLPALSNAHMASIISTYTNVLFIEDTVHRLTNPQDIHIYGTNHVMIDSLRKVSPLPGSFLYQARSDAEVLPDRITREWQYVVSSFALYTVFRFCFVTGTVLSWPALIRFAHTVLLKRHDDVIGDSIGGYPGHPIIPKIHAHIHFAKVRAFKERQVLLYMSLLQPFLRTHRDWSIPSIDRKIYGDLHVFPLILSGSDAPIIYKQIETYLLHHGIVCWFKFPDAPWSRNHLVLFLPLGFHIGNRHIHSIARVLSALPAFSAPEA